MTIEKTQDNKNSTNKDKVTKIVDIDSEIKKEIYNLSKTMSTGIKRWAKVIYPMMIAFIILATYGFYLIYNVTNDMSKISKSVEEMNFSVSQMTASVFQMVTITGIQMGNIDKQMNNINLSMKEMNGKMDGITGMEKSLEKMNNTLNAIYQSVYYMGQATGQMNSNFSELNNNISKPLDSMNNVMPWSMFSSKKYKNNQNRYLPPPAYSPYRNPAMNGKQGTVQQSKELKQ